MKKLLSVMLLVFICMFIFIGCHETEITEEKAAKLAKSFIEKNLMGMEEETVYFDSPIVKEIEFENSYIVYYAEKNDEKLREADLKEKTVWEVVYRTNLDARLGPKTIYLDKYSGEIYGFCLRQ